MTPAPRGKRGGEEFKGGVGVANAQSTNENKMTASGTNSFNYEERIVAFVDVLGFADLVVASDADQIARAQVSNLLGADRLFDKYMTESQLGTATFFSDSFIISMTPPDRIFYMVREVGYLCRYLLLQGFLCRGAITVGSIYHQDQAVVGPAFIRAYQLERSIAIYPRVILDAAALEYWRAEFALSPAHSHLESLVKCDLENKYFIDIFNSEWGYNFVPWTELVPLFRSIPNDPTVFREAAKMKIQAGLAAHVNNLNIRTKYEWLNTECG